MIMPTSQFPCPTLSSPFAPSQNHIVFDNPLSPVRVVHMVMSVKSATRTWPQPQNQKDSLLPST